MKAKVSKFIFRSLSVMKGLNKLLGMNLFNARISDWKIIRFVKAVGYADKKSQIRKDFLY